MKIRQSYFYGFILAAAIFLLPHFSFAAPNDSYLTQTVTGTVNVSDCYANGPIDTCNIQIDFIPSASVNAAWIGLLDNSTSTSDWDGTVPALTCLDNSSWIQDISPYGLSQQNSPVPGSGCGDDIEGDAQGVYYGLSGGSPPTYEPVALTGGLSYTFTGGYEYDPVLGNPFPNGSTSVSLFVIPPSVGSLQQYLSDGVTPVADGANISGNSVVLSAVPQESFSTDPLQEQFEVGPYGSSFSGVPTVTSGSVAPGQAASGVVSGLLQGSYEWQARTLDTVTTAVSPWQEFGASGNPAFVVPAPIVTAPTLEGVNQYEQNGVTSIPEGGTAGATIVDFGATMQSSATTTAQLQVEIESSSTPFTGVATMTSAFVASGTSVTVSSPALPNGAYHWQARAVDSENNSSTWQAFSGNAPGTDFIINVPSPVITISSLPTSTVQGATTTLVFSFSDPSGPGIVSSSATMNGTPVVSGQVVNFGTSGTSTFRFFAEDAAGNSTVITDTVYVHPLVVVTFAPTADTYVALLNPDANFGTATALDLLPLDINRVLVQFSQNSIQAAIPASSTILSAQLQMTISANYNGWSKSGSDSITAYRTTMPWTETGATWFCSNTTSTKHNLPNCPTSSWDMTGILIPSLRPFATSTTDIEPIANNQTGTIAFNVTTDVRSFVTGQAQDYGWLLKKTNLLSSGWVNFASKESTSSPELVVTYVGN